MHVTSSTGFQKAWTSLWSCSWGFCGLQILHTQDHNQIGSVPSQKHILALHTSATSAAGVSAGVSAFTYRHKHGTFVNHLSLPANKFYLHPFYMHRQIHPESTLICLCTRITRRTWRTKHDNFHCRRFLESCLKKFPAAPCTCCFAYASSSDILHWGESTKVR